MGYFAYGYGIYMDDYTLNNDVIVNMIELLPDYLAEEFEDNWCDNSAYGDYSSKVEFFPEWAKYYYYNYTGDIIAPLMADIINSREFDDRAIFHGDENCLLAVPFFSHKTKCPTLEKVSEVFDKYITSIFGDYKGNKPMYQFFKEL